MFSKIRRTAYILSYKHHPLHPDLPDHGQADKPVSGISRLIGTSIQLFIISVVVGLVAARAAKLLFPHELKLSLETVSGIFGALVVLFGQYALRLIENLVHSKIGNPLAPYFGHKLEETIRTIKSHSA